MNYDVEIMDLKDRVSSLETKREHTNTALGKIIVILEETRLRVTAFETRQENVEARLGKVETRLDRIEHEINGLRRDMPSIVVDAMREVLKEQKS